MFSMYLILLYCFILRVRFGALKLCFFILLYGVVSEVNNLANLDQKSDDRAHLPYTRKSPQFNTASSNFTAVIKPIPEMLLVPAEWKVCFVWVSSCRLMSSCSGWYCLTYRRPLWLRWCLNYVRLGLSTGKKIVGLRLPKPDFGPSVVSVHGNALWPKIIFSSDLKQKSSAGLLSNFWDDLDLTSRYLELTLRFFPAVVFVVGVLNDHGTWEKTNR